MYCFYIGVCGGCYTDCLNCISSLGEFCSHVAALLFNVEAGVNYGLNNPTPTETPCEWRRASGKSSNCFIFSLLQIAASARVFLGFLLCGMPCVRYKRVWKCCLIRWLNMLHARCSCGGHSILQTPQAQGNTYTLIWFPSTPTYMHRWAIEGILADHQGTLKLCFSIDMLKRIQKYVRLEAYIPSSLHTGVSYCDKKKKPFSF